MSTDAAFWPIACEDCRRSTSGHCWQHPIVEYTRSAPLVVHWRVLHAQHTYSPLCDGIHPPGSCKPPPAPWAWTAL